MYQYDSLLAAINGLKERGYTIDFNIEFDQIICSEKKYCLNPHEFEITEAHRFDGDTNPSDESVIYAVKSLDGKLKGMMISAYGVYAENMSNEILEKLKMHTH